MVHAFPRLRSGVLHDRAEISSYIARMILGSLTTCGEHGGEQKVFPNGWRRSEILSDAMEDAEAAVRGKQSKAYITGATAGRVAIVFVAAKDAAAGCSDEGSTGVVDGAVASYGRCRGICSAFG